MSSLEFANKQEQVQQVKKVPLMSLLRNLDVIQAQNMVALLVEEIPGRDPELVSIGGEVWETAQLVRDENGQICGIPVCMGG